MRVDRVWTHDQSTTTRPHRTLPLLSLFMLTIVTIHMKAPLRAHLCPSLC